MADHPDDRLDPLNTAVMRFRTRSGWDNDHLARRSPGDLRRDTAEDEPANVQAGPGSKDDHVGVLGPRSLEDGLRRVTLPDEKGGPNPGITCLPDDRLRT